MMIRAVVSIVASALLLCASASLPAYELTLQDYAAMLSMNPKLEASWIQRVTEVTQINSLVKHIRALKDSKRVVRLVVKHLGKKLPQGLVSQKMEMTLAEAEYRSITQPDSLIPDQRIADAWNEYLNTVGAPKKEQVSAALIYNLRDADHASALELWDSPLGKGLQTMPAIYSVGTGGKLRQGATALEAALVLDDLATMPSTMRAARNRLKQGVLLSEWRKHPPKSHHIAIFAYERTPYPVTVATQKYIAGHGEAEYAKVVANLVGAIFTAQTAGGTKSL